MDGYGISTEDAENVLKKGMKWKEEKSEKWHAQMAGIECVFIKESDTAFIVTVYKEAK